jgi:hypothetical protein
MIDLNSDLDTGNLLSDASKLYSLSDSYGQLAATLVHGLPRLGAVVARDIINDLMLPPRKLGN